MIFKQLNVNIMSDGANIIPCLSTCAQSVSLCFIQNIDTLIDCELYDFTNSITEQLTIQLDKEDIIISVTVLNQLLDMFPNAKSFNLSCRDNSKIEGAWPSTHYTNLRSFNEWGRI